jgi:hypothetical protein
MVYLGNVLFFSPDQRNENQEKPESCQSYPDMPHIIEVESDDKPEGASSMVLNPIQICHPTNNGNHVQQPWQAYYTCVNQHLNQNKMLISITDSKHCAKVMCGRNRV